jgi:hypothetical protein
MGLLVRGGRAVAHLDLVLVLAQGSLREHPAGAETALLMIRIHWTLIATVQTRWSMDGQWMGIVLELRSFRVGAWLEGLIEVVVVQLI